jgi:hypothetical protein
MHVNQRNYHFSSRQHRVALHQVLVVHFAFIHRVKIGAVRYSAVCPKAWATGKNIIKQSLKR